MRTAGSGSERRVSLTHRQRTEARQAAYGLLADLFRTGPAPEHVELLSELGLLTEDLPQDTDVVASEHFALFGLDVLPYASWFLEPGGMLGGSVTEMVARLARRFLGDVHVRDEPDHISSELELIAALGGHDATSESFADELVEFLDGHVLWWLPAFAFAVGRSGSGFYSRAADVLVELVASHRQALGVGASEESVLPEPFDILADDRTDVRQIAHYLATPALSGIVLLRSRIVAAGRTLGLPRGFGDRRLMIGNLLRSAAEYGAVADVAALLAKEVEAWKDFYGSLGAEWPDEFACICKQWLVRLELTASILERLTAAVSTGARVG